MKAEILKLRKEGKTYKEISQILNCAKSTISFHCTKENLGFSQDIIHREIIDCIKREYKEGSSRKEIAAKYKLTVYTVKKYTKDITKPTKYDSSLTRKQKIVIAVTAKRKKLKIQAIEYKGGCCELCGYNKFVGALDFHHKDPKTKEFSISSKGYTRSWGKVKEELDKCVLLCSNCHREIHYNKNLIIK